MALPAVLSLAPSLVQGVMGIAQNRRANKVRPDSYVPPSLNRAIGINESLASKSVSPGYNQAIQDINEAQESTMDAAIQAGGNASQIQETISRADAGTKNTLRALQANNENYRENNLLRLNNSLIQKSDFEQRNRDKYNAAKSALRGASQQNLYNSITNAAEAGILGLGRDNTILS